MRRDAGALRQGADRCPTAQVRISGSVARIRLNRSSFQGDASAGIARHRLPTGVQAGALRRVSKDETASMTSAIGGTGPMIIVAIAL